MLAVGLGSPLVSCGGSSSGGDGSHGGQGGSASGKGGTAGSATSGTGGFASGCDEDGKHYELGETWGVCDRCTCTSSGPNCKIDACGFQGGASGTGASGGTGGAGGSGASGLAGAPAGCDVGGVHYDDGDSWPSDCNTCWCQGDLVACTMVACQGGMGGGGSGGMPAGGAGRGGEAGEPTQCEIVEAGSFCVKGKPSDDGYQDLEVGMPLVIETRAEGCFSSSCTELVDSSCNYIGMEGVYAIGTFMCLDVGGDGDLCTADCGGAPTVECEPGLTLEEREYTLTLSGTSFQLKFEVPSHVPNDRLCAEINAP